MSLHTSIASTALPDPEKQNTATQREQFIAANKEIRSVEMKAIPKKTRASYSDDVKIAIAKKCIEVGPTKTIQHFVQRDIQLTGSTVRTIRDKYLKAKKDQQTDDPVFKSSRRGRVPFFNFELEKELVHYVKELRKEGGILNGTIMVAIAHGFMKVNPTCGLTVNQVTLSWAKSFLRRHHFVKRKSTKSANKIPVDFPELKQHFLNNIDSKISENAIPPSMVVNFDQTSCKLVPDSNWTLEGIDTTQDIDLEDKREITCLLGIAVSGLALPPQLIYHGKTPRCHAQGIVWPSDWTVTHTETKWSKIDTMQQYVTDTLIPFFNNQRNELNLPSEHKALAIFDVYKLKVQNMNNANEDFLSLLQKNNIEYVFIPPCCSQELQPLDLCYNKSFKDLMRLSYIQWTSGLIEEHLRTGTMMTNNHLKASVIKPVHAEWMIQNLSKLSTKKELIIKGFQMAGIV